MHVEKNICFVEGKIIGKKLKRCLEESEMEFGFMHDRCRGKMIVFWILAVGKYSMKSTI